MPVEVLSIGAPILMKAGVVYALPAAEVTLYTDASSPSFQQSTTSGFVSNTAPTLTAGAVKVNGGFIKVLADAMVTLKRD